MWWEVGKRRVKGLTISYCSRRSRSASQERDLLVRLAKHLKSRLDIGLVSCLGAYRSVLDRLSGLDSTADRSKFAQMTRSKNIFVSTDNLSSSLDDLLESCRQGSEKQLNAGNSVIKVETNGRLSNSFSEIANGQTSHNPEVEGLRYDLQAVQVIKNRTYQGSRL